LKALNMRENPHPDSVRKVKMSERVQLSLLNRDQMPKVVPSAQRERNSVNKIWT
jgi:hypothetical protein